MGMLDGITAWMTNDVLKEHENAVVVPVAAKATPTDDELAARVSELETMLQRYSDDEVLEALWPTNAGCVPHYLWSVPHGDLPYVDECRVTWRGGRDGVANKNDRRFYGADLVIGKGEAGQRTARFVTVDRSLNHKELITVLHAAPSIIRNLPDAPARLAERARLQREAREAEAARVREITARFDAAFAGQKK